ncbi:PfkB family carbohydrate kinase [Roseicella aquatilis]|uniref:Ribokinase n=1 Tax=Roseicella aquatilis TaxID=2527868 RepID=A0A4R4DSR4_9PROT|nr:PfkB family carbohydrate kinase [Roseicella aquatilis]TCZ64415.1 ribokinase [Roseicella aquatilis]
MPVLVFGSVVADLVFAVPSLPAPGLTVLAPGYAALPGGKGANQAVAAALDGAAAAFAGAVGADAMAEVALSGLRGAGIDLSRLAVVEAPTACAAVCVDPAGRNQIAVGSGANLRARAAQVEEAALSPATVLLMQMEVPPSENAALIRRARARGARVLLNLAPAGPMEAEALRALDLLVANEHEAAWLAAHLGCGADAAGLHRALGIDVAVTLGEAGAEAATGAGHLRLPAVPVRAVDTTGAGDAWCGVLAAALDRGLPLEAAMRRASAAAALACTRPGAAAMPRAAETDGLLRQA